ncbi:pyocin knob domain-containing protein, partial [Aeromonas salmonicida]
MAKEKVLDIVKSTKSIITPYNVISDGKIASSKNAGLENTDDTYGQRMVLSGSYGYFQAGKKDRDVNDQKIIFSGWFGTPLSNFRISMATGVQPQVYQGGVNYDLLHRGNMPTPEDISAMAIYDRPSGDDCDNAVLPGNYAIYGNTTNTPYGIGPSGSTLLVTKWGGSSNSQIFFSYTADRVFIRRRQNSIWMAWTELYTSANKQPVGGMGLGVGDAPNALTITGNVRDFNLAKINGTFTIEGSWANGIDNSAAATTHTGILQVSQRAFDNMTIQTFSYHVNVADLTTQRSFTRIWQNSATGWSPWIATGVWESVNTYRTGILRHNNATNDDSVYPYVSYTKEKYRDAVAVGTPYTVGEIGFRAG